MQKVHCPSCGREIRPDSDLCDYCKNPVTGQKQTPVVEPISPYDDLFSDDVIPEKPKKVKPPIKGPELPSDLDFSEPAYKKGGSVPVLANREILFVAGIVSIVVILLIALFFLPTTPPSDVQSNMTSVEIAPENTTTTTEPITPVPTQKSTSEDGFSVFDNFSDKESGWGSYESDSFLRYYSSGEYHMIQKGEDLSDRVLFGKDVENFVTNVDARLDSGPLTGQYGIIFRFDNGNYYSFVINGRGWYSVRKHIDGKIYELIPLTETYILNKGYETNKLGVKAEGNTLSMYINGKMVRAIGDTSISHGDVGFYVSRLAEQGFVKEQPVHVAFDNFKYGELSS
ncbi:hypothetical protein [Methanospirillum sp.]